MSYKRYNTKDAFGSILFAAHLLLVLALAIDRELDYTTCIEQMFVKGENEMRFVEIYFSPTGGTKKVSEILSSVWDGDYEKVIIDLMTKEDIWADMQLCSEDICLIALPSYGGRIPSITVEYLHKINGNGAKAILVAVYGNRHIDDTLVEMEDIAKASGFVVIAGIEAIAEHSIVRQFATGRPDEADKMELEKFACQIKEKLENGNLTAPILPGNRPYRVFNGACKPIVTDECVACGLCAAECPVLAIPENNCRVTEIEKCISCMHCISVCPQQARKIEENILEGLSAKLEPICSVRKNNVLYI